MQTIVILVIPALLAATLAYVLILTYGSSSVGPGWGYTLLTIIAVLAVIGKVYLVSEYQSKLDTQLLGLLIMMKIKTEPSFREEKIKKWKKDHPQLQQTDKEIVDLLSENIEDLIEYPSAKYAVAYLALNFILYPAGFLLFLPSFLEFQIVGLSVYSALGVQPFLYILISAWLDFFVIVRSNEYMNPEIIEVHTIKERYLGFSLREEKEKISLITIYDVAKSDERPTVFSQHRITLEIPKKEVRLITRHFIRERGKRRV